MANNTNVLKILRNQSLFASREAAITNIEAKVSAGVVHDGEIWFASYTDTQDNSKTKTILAFYHLGHVTTIDIDNVWAEGIKNSPITASPTKVAVTGDNVADQIESLATSLKTTNDNISGSISQVFKYKIKKLTQEEVSALSDENVKEAYKLVSWQGEETAQTVYTQVGDIIKIYKDTSLKEVYIGDVSDTINTSTGVITKYVYSLKTDPTTKITQDTYDNLSSEQKELYELIDAQNLNFAYQLADATYTIVKIDVNKFLTESEFKDGLEPINGVVRVKIDSTSEKDSQSTPVDFLTVSLDGVKVSGIKDEINRKIAALNVSNDTVQTGQYVAAIEEANGVVAVKKRANVSEAVLNNYTKGSDEGALAHTDTINQAFSKLENNIASNQTALGNVLEGVSAGNGINVSTKANKLQTISAKLNTTLTDNALTLDSDGLYFSKTIDCGTY